MADDSAIAEAEVAVVSKAPRGWSARIVKWSLGAVAAILALLLLGVILLNTPIGQRFIADQIAKVAPASGLRFEVGRIDGDIYGQSTLHDVTVFDPKGAFLTIPEVELDWRPLSWITSGLDVRNLTLRRGTLLRTPELLAGDPDAPILPDFDIRIDRFEIDSLKITEGIVGDSAPVIDLLAKADIRDGRVFLKADGNLGELDTLALLIDAEPDGDRFDIKLDYQAPAGGVLAGLTGADAGYTAKIDGDGSWDRWDGYIYATRDGERFAAFKLNNRQGTYHLLGQAYPAALVSGLPAQAIGDTVSIDALGTLVDSVLDGRFAIVTRALTGTGRGVIDLADNNFQGLSIAGSLTDPALFGENLTLNGANFTATLDGAFRDLEIEHSLSVEELRSGETLVAGLIQNGTATFDGTRWNLPLDAAVQSIKTGNAWIDPKLAGGTFTGSLIYAGSKLLSDDLQIAFADTTARLALRGDVASGIYQLTGPVNVTQLALENVGTVNGNAKIDFQLRDSGNWALVANFSARIPRVTNETLANLAGPDIRLVGGVSLGTNKPLNFRNVRLAAENLSLTMDGKVQQGTTSLAGRGSHTQYGPFTVEASLGADGPTATLVFANPLPSAGLKDVRVAISPSDAGFDIATQGQSLIGEFAGELALVSPEDGPSRIDIEELRVWKTAVTGNLTLADGGADGRLLLSGGGLDGRIGLATRDGGQGFFFDVDARQASFGGATPLSIARATLEGRGYLKEGFSTVDANVTAQGLSYGSIFIGRLAAAAEMENGVGTATGSIAGRRGSRFALQMNADIKPGSYGIIARGEFGGKRITMPRRAMLTQLDDGSWSLAQTQLSYGNGSSLISGQFGGGTTAIDLALDQMPLSLVDLAVTDVGLGGVISGRLDYRKVGSAMPVANARIKVDNLTRSGLVLSSRPMNLALVADLKTRELGLRAVIQEGGERRGRLQARVSGLSQSSDLVERLRTGNLLAQLRFNGPAASLWRLAGVEAFDITGPVSVATNITGSFANPSVRGSVESKDLRVRSAVSGTDIQNVSAFGTFSGSRLQLKRFAGKTNNGGTVSGSGYVDFEGLGPKGPSLDIRVATNKARLLNATGLDATITGPLRIISDGNGGTIAGRVSIDRASWALGSAATDATLPQIKTTEFNLPIDIAPPRIRYKPWRYLIDAKARSRIDVGGMGLDSEWAADIIIRGTTDDPRIGGAARLVRGFYSFAGTRFEITRGRIDFDANAPIDPRLDIVAETERSGLDVTVKVQGNALNPEITFGSAPALPEEEVLARLLFGGSITDLSATDALQLGSALASLRGGTGLDPINKLRTAIGLDRLRIVSADPALGRGTGVAIGKNIGRRFYVEIITDGRGYSATEAEFRITGWLSLLASVSTIGRESAVVEVSRDY
ncbi:translocation/assembly module TamB domain-containing protein [Pontixanthobacter gangjinensis]|uniref:DUF490 domain-containing protein n=1 Tax=Pontixanthobacter gangjinensis TaxID=1028742 RepID=A0A6I4SLU5_9SPHN|nr:translocation/assembly module TamB domain-containing protein [Pontixanthobacter gangjinensis]MXO56408.1 DUF490 domain-containing protein [Pontixanthobacter gangjinensis]